MTSKPPSKHGPPKPRLCLHCGKKFESAWAGERVCKRCKGTADWRGAAMC